MDNDTTSPIEWRDIPEWETIYQINNAGQARRIKVQEGKPYRYLTSIAMPNKYLVCHLRYLGRDARPYTHRLVLAAFVGPCPEGHEVNHKNGNRADNRLENLEYVTHAQNVQHTVHVLKNNTRGERVNGAVLDEDKVREIRRLYIAGMTQTEIGKLYAVHHRLIWQVVHRETWKHVE